MEGTDATAAPLPVDVRDRLSASMGAATKAERQIAQYMLTNLRSLPFETAATVAATRALSTNRIVELALARTRPAASISRPSAKMVRPPPRSIQPSAITSPGMAGAK